MFYFLVYNWNLLSERMSKCWIVALTKFCQSKLRNSQSNLTCKLLANDEFFKELRADGDQE